jgi:uncharacterized protein
VISQTILGIFSGALVGLLLGATGGGGSLIALPLLVYLVAIPVQHATAMSLLVVGYSALFGAWQASRQGLVKGRVALIFSSTGTLGAWVGAQGHRVFSHELILFLLGVLLVSISLWTLYANDSPNGENGESGGAPHLQFSLSFFVEAITIGFGVGLISGFFGIGGGFIMVPALMFVLRFPIRMAVGTSFLIIALTSVGGIIGHLDIDHLDIPLTGFVILGSLAGMIVGARIARMMGEQTLKKTFAMLVGFTGLLVMLDNAWRLVTVESSFN